MRFSPAQEERNLNEKITNKKIIINLYFDIIVLNSCLGIHLFIIINILFLYNSDRLFLIQNRKDLSIEEICQITDFWNETSMRERKRYILVTEQVW